MNLLTIPKCPQIRLKFRQHNIPPKWNDGKLQPVENSKKMFLGHPSAEPGTGYNSGEWRVFLAIQGFSVLS